MTDVDKPAPKSRVPARAQRAAARGTAVAERGRLWIENQAPDSRKGATIGWFRRYQAADGQLYAVLLSAYFLVTVLPVMLVAGSYLYSDPHALADRAEHRLRLHGATATLFSSVLVGAGEHKVSAVFIAVVDLFFFGLGFGRVLQLAHARSWGLDLRKSVVVDQAATPRCWPRSSSGCSCSSCRRGCSGDSRRGSAMRSTSSGWRCCSGSSSGRRARCSTTASPDATSFPAPSSRWSGWSGCA